MPETHSPIRIQPPSFRHFNEFADLLSLVNPTEPIPSTVLTALVQPPGLLTHGTTLCLTAREHDQAVGALIASPPRWAHTHHLHHQLTCSVVNIAGVAVLPSHRMRGIATKLLRAAERHCRQAALRLLTLEHPEHLTDFYTRLRFIAGQERQIVALPGRALHERQVPGYLAAVKPLAPGVGVAEVPDAPARIVTGLLPGCQVSPTARYHRGRLIG